MKINWISFVGLSFTSFFLSFVMQKQNFWMIVAASFVLGMAWPWPIVEKD